MVNIHRDGDYFVRLMLKRTLMMISYEVLLILLYLCKSFKETDFHMFSTWNNLEGFNDENLGLSNTATSLYLDDEDTIPVIPDIEDLQDQDFIQQTAEAPTVEINRIDNLEELDKKVRKTPFLSSSNDKIDLTILAINVCLPEDKIRENDIPWTWDSLITDIMYNVDVINLAEKEQENITI